MSQCHSVYQKSHMDWPLIETGPPLISSKPATHQLARGGAFRWGTAPQARGLTPDGVTGIFHWPHSDTGVYSASNRNEYQGYLLWSKSGRRLRLTSRLSWNWEPQPPGILGVCPGLYRDCFTLTYQLTFWRRNFFFILARPVYKMRIIQEPNMLKLWNELHFEEKKKTESIYHV